MSKYPWTHNRLMDLSVNAVEKGGSRQQISLHFWKVFVHLFTRPIDRGTVSSMLDFRCEHLWTLGWCNGIWNHDGQRWKGNVFKNNSDKCDCIYAGCSMPSDASAVQLKAPTFNPFTHRGHYSKSHFLIMYGFWLHSCTSTSTVDSSASSFILPPSVKPHVDFFPPNQDGRRPVKNAKLPWNIHPFLLS